MAESAALKSYKKTKKSKKLKNHPKPNASRKSSKNFVNVYIWRLWPNRKFHKIMKHYDFSVFQTNFTQMFVFQIFTNYSGAPWGSPETRIRRKTLETSCYFNNFTLRTLEVFKNTKNSRVFHICDV